MSAFHRRALLWILWIGTFVIVAASVVVRNRTATERSTQTPPALPARGDTIVLARIDSLFGTQLQRASDSGSNSWLLVLTSNCKWCLSLGDELDTISRTAQAEMLTLVPLLVELSQPADSMLAILAAHGLTAAGVAGPEGLSSLGVFQVPTIVEVDSAGSILRVIPHESDAWPGAGRRPR